MRPERAINIAIGCVMASCMDSEMKQAVIEALNQSATPKMETTSCEWCNGKEYTIDSRDYTCLEITGNKLTAWGEGEATGHINYCPNCGRKLDWED